ncbi:Helitron helicase [Phytophthora megakarya]|uniref:Helitron helicase n=1 Tax=Phytophthora megakarya TaxID=4795 RepID=A0A225W403_9STRA|nr:Helitron helicase [Phytophthora megakarya]
MSVSRSVPPAPKFIHRLNFQNHILPPFSKPKRTTEERTQRYAACAGNKTALTNSNVASVKVKRIKLEGEIKIPLRGLSKDNNRRTKSKNNGRLSEKELAPVVYVFDLDMHWQTTKTSTSPAFRDQMWKMIDVSSPLWSNATSTEHGNDPLRPLKPVPDALPNFYKDMQFRKNFRAYNSAFGVVSAGAPDDKGHIGPVREDRSVQGARGIYTHRVQGEFSHYLGTSIPPIDRSTGEMRSPTFAQIYVVDEDIRKQTERRTGIFSGLDQGIRMTLDMMLAQCNPNVGQFISHGEKIRKDIAEGKETVNLTLHLHSDKRRPGITNLPTVSEVGVVMVDDGNS